MFRRAAHDDLDAVRRTLAGDREAYGVLVERYFGVVHAVIYAQTGNHSDAEDLTQEALVKALQSLDKLKDPPKFGPWLVTIARNCGLTFLRKRARRESLSRHLEFSDIVEPNDPVKSEVSAIVRNSLQALAENEREVLLLHYFSGKPVREIARLLGVSKAAAEKRLSRARETLGVHLLRDLDLDKEAGRRQSSHVRKTIAVVAASPVAWQPRAAGVVAAGGRLPNAGIVAVAAITIALVAAWLAWPRGNPVLTERTEAVVERGQNDASADGLQSQPRGETPLAPQTAESARSMNRTLESVTPRSDEPPADAARVAGRVYDVESGLGLPNVAILATQGDDIVPAWTDEGGNFDFPDLPKGTWQISHDPVEGYQNSDGLEDDSVHLDLDDADRFTGVGFPMSQGTRFTGVVVDTNGNPIAGARVYSATQSYEDYNETRSHEDGSFVLTAGLCPIGTGIRNYHIVASKDGFSTTLVEFGSLTDARQRHFRLVMNAEAVISGMLVDQSGNPQSGYGVSWTSKGQFLGIPGGPTDSAGRFRLGGLPAGEIQIRVFPPGSSARSWGRQLFDVHRLTVGERLIGVVATLPPPREPPFSGRIESPAEPPSGVGTLFGNVIDGATGEPVQSFRIRSFRSEEEYAARQMIGTKSYYTESSSDRLAQLLPKRIFDPDGGFWLDEVAAGTYLVEVQADGYAGAVYEASPVSADGPTGPIEIELATAITLTGFLTDDSGRPIEGARIYLADPRPVPGFTWISESMVVDSSVADGSFEVEGLAVGPTRLRVTHEDYFPGDFTIDVKPTDNEILQFRLNHGGTIEGTVLVNGKPATGQASVCFLVTRIDGYEFSESCAQELSEGGKYKLTRLKTNTGRVRCEVRLAERRNNRITVFRPVAVEEGNTTSLDVDIRSGTTTLSGYVLDESGGVGRAQVQLLIESKDVEQWDVVRTRDDGFFELRDIHPGNATLIVRTDSAAVPTLKFQIPPNANLRQDIPLFGGMSVEYRVINMPSQTDSAGISILQGARQFEDPNDQVFIKTAGAEGIATVSAKPPYEGRFVGLEPGTYTVICRPSLFNEIDHDSPLRRAALPYAVVTVSEEDPVAQVELYFEEDWLESHMNQ